MGASILTSTDTKCQRGGRQEPNAGDDYTQLHPVYSICLVNGILWKDAEKVHHAFRLTDLDSGRILDKTIEIHTLELGRYDLMQAELATANMRDRWLFWFLHAHEYEPEALLKLLSEAAMQLATQTITKIALATGRKSWGLTSVVPPDSSPRHFLD